MIIDSEHIKDDFTIYNARYFGGGNLNDLESCYIAKRGKYYSHGKTIKQAIKDVNFKYLQEHTNLDELVSDIKDKQTVSVTEYRLLTGACRLEVNKFLEDNNIKTDILPLDKVLEIIKNQYGNEKMYKLFK